MILSRKHWVVVNKICVFYAREAAFNAVAVLGADPGAAATLFFDQAAEATHFPLARPKQYLLLLAIREVAVARLELIDLSD